MNIKAMPITAQGGQRELGSDNVGIVCHDAHCNLFGLFIDGDNCGEDSFELLRILGILYLSLQVRTNFHFRDDISHLSVSAA